MLRTVLLTAAAFAIAVLGGAASVWYALERREGAGALTIGVWTAFPELGTPDADPYSRARVAREGFLMLGRAEGLSFTATRDSGGAPLRRECSYAIEGIVPSARFWTLFAADASLRPLAPEAHRHAAIHSQQVLRGPGNVVSIGLSSSASPGNWIAVSGSGPLAVVLTLYDTPAASNAGFAEIDMPRIERGRCDV